MKKNAFYSALPLKTRALRAATVSATSVLISLVPGISQALGLGDVNHSSYLGEPLRGNIKLINVSPDINPINLKVRQIHRQEAVDLGVDLVSTWQPVNLSLDSKNNTFQINLSTTKPIKEPLVNMLVELSWPKGKIYREYSIFLDPPRIAKQQTTQLVTTSQNMPTRSQNPAVAAVTEKAVVQESINPDQPYAIAPGDTLYGIAAQVAKAVGGDTQSTAQWIFANNSQAFIGGDINKMIAGSSLLLPGHGTSQKLASTKTPAPPAATGQVKLARAVSPEEASQATGLETRIAANETMMEQLIKENRDLRDRLAYIENSDYLTTMKELVDAQQREIALLREQVLPTNTSQPEAITVASATVAGSTADAPLETLKLGAAPMFALTSDDREKDRNQAIWSAIFAGVMASLTILATAIRVFGRKQKVVENTEIEAAENLDVTSPSIHYSEPTETNKSPSDFLQDELESIDELLAENGLDDPHLEAYVPDNLDLTEPVIADNPVIPQRIYTIPERQHNHKLEGLPETEKEKIKIIQEQIKEKMGTYEGAQNPASNDHHVEEIEIDEDMESYLKL